jgi:hypothetical protein
MTLLSKLSPRLALVAAAIVITLGTQSVSAQSFTIPANGFTATNVCANSTTIAPACQVVTNGTPNQPQVLSNGVLRLTTADQDLNSSAWFAVQQPLAIGFTTAFQFQVSSTNLCQNCTFGADGLALVIQNDPAGIGALGFANNGGNLSYGNNDIPTATGPGHAILNSLAIELDTHLNEEFGDPDGNHIAVQSCGPNNASTLSPNSADHNYLCPNGSPAKLALQSLPAGMSLSDGLIHTITVNYLPPANCASNCNNLSVYFDSTLILQTTVDLAQQLNLSGNGSAYIGFTAATGTLVENSDIVSWSFSKWPLAPITINQPVQPTATNFNYTSTLSAITDYSQSGLPANSFQGLIMQGTVQNITDQQFADLVSNTPFQGSTCQHQDTGNGTFGCVTTTDLCTNPASSVPAGLNCLTTGSNPLIGISNTYNLDPAQKPVVAPGYIMGKDTALSCGATADNTCKGLVSVFTSITGDALTTGGHTNNFNSVLIPILGSVQPSTSVSTTPPLNSGWTNGNLAVNFNSIESVPANNTNPPSSLPTIASINYTVSGANVPSSPSGSITGPTGSFTIPVTVEGTTVVSYAATDSSNIIETLVTNSGLNVSSATPTFTFKVDLTAPTLSCTPPASAWQQADVTVPCMASDSGSGLVGPSSFSASTNVPVGTETNSATIPPVTVKDVAGNASAPQPSQGSFGPFQVDKKAPVIVGPSALPASPVFGQTVTANFSCTDGGSGVVQCGPSGSATFPATASTGALSLPVDSTVGTHTFTVLAQDAVGNASAPSLVSYVVAKATPTIAWATPAAITFGTALGGAQLNASASVPGIFMYSAAAGTVLKAGIQTLSVTFTPTDTTDYTSASASVQLIVNKATPAITWAMPASIKAGTPLGSAQLNATANVPGKFVYLPQAGIVLAAGTQTLSVTFTPNDIVDYTIATATVSLVVTPSQPQISISPASINFGTVAFGSLLTQTETVSNTGSAPLVVSKVSLTLGPGTGPLEFAFLSGCVLPVPPGGNCKILVLFLADQLGSQTATLVLKDNAPGSPHSVSITSNVIKHK